MNGRFLKAARCLVGVTLIALGASTASAAVNRHHPGSSKRLRYEVTIAFRRITEVFQRRLRLVPTSIRRISRIACVDPAHRCLFPRANEGFCFFDIDLQPPLNGWLQGSLCVGVTP